ncbi:MAG: hypothetical protein KDC66_02040 [Phaeodactylibacter sp.]|nr:hypothetical protein [Phaeodactylibacter sp.]MCB9276668.1 hypothetical protein [Lewinellaceae bacterium]
MKPLVMLSSLLFLLAFSKLQAQATEHLLKMSQGANNALSLQIAGADEKLVAETWKNYMKDFYDAKVKWDRKTKEYLADDASITAIGLGNTVDVYATTEEDKNNNTTINVWFDLGGAFLSSREHADRYEEAEKLMLRFGLEVAREKTRLELDNEKGELRQLQKDLERLKTANDRYHKEIERAQEAIKKAEADIVQNEKDQQDMLEKIAGQEKAIQSVEQRLNGL